MRFSAGLVARRMLVYNSARIPTLNVRPSSGAHTSVMGLPPSPRVGRTKGSNRV
jgi:hypothetical protein